MYNSDKFLKLIFDNVPYGIFWKSPESVYLGCNSAYRELVGIEAVDLAGKSEWDLNVPEVAEMFVMEDKKLLESRQNIYHRERSFNRHGKELSVSTSKVLILDERGEPFVILGIVEDISETVKIRRQLVEAIEKAENANRAKSDFLSRMSHEIRTPMNAIIGMTKIALNAGNTPKMLNSLEKIDVASKQLLSIINDILDMSKIEAQKFEINSEVFDFKAMVEKIYNIILVKTEEKNIKFVLDINGGIADSYIGDDFRLTQVIINLLGNAVKFTPEYGTIKLTANILPDSAGANHTVLEFRVIDTGIGISREQQEKLFNSFEQADGTIARKYGGTGLGLAISKNIVGLMGGNIRVESELGKGSSFIFTVKLKNNDAPFVKSHNLNDSETDDFSNYHIIIAEDIDINREIVAAILEDTKLNIDFAVNGEEAYELFSADQEKYDLILMDIQMPVLNGYEATKMIRRLGTAKAINIPVIAMTASAFLEDIEESKKAGMNSHIAKPIDISILMEKLREYLLYSRKNAGYPVSDGVRVKSYKSNELKESKITVTADMLLPDINLRDRLERINNNKKLFVSLMKSFKGKELLDNLTNALDNNKINESISIASIIKGLGANLSMPLIYSNALCIENCLKSSGYLIEPEYLTRLKEAFDAVSKKIELIINNNLE